MLDVTDNVALCGFGRFVLSFGDLATGRISREDVAQMLTSCLTNENAASKTFEVFVVPGLVPLPLDECLKNIPVDSAAKDEGIEGLQASYRLLRQLRPTV
jgi:hypothetical protein